MPKQFLSRMENADDSELFLFTFVPTFLNSQLLHVSQNTKSLLLLNKPNSLWNWWTIYCFPQQVS